MRNSKSIKWSLLIIGVFAIACFSLAAFFTHLDLSDRIYTVQAKTLITEPVMIQKQINPGIPIHLKIAKINIDSTIEHVGLTTDGAIGVPTDPMNAAWYNLGPLPGNSGNAILTGHYGRWKNGSGSIFDHLDQLVAGDSIVIEGEDGTEIAFTVRAMQHFDAEANLADVLGVNDGKSHLVLITCEGIWNAVSKSYPKRLVVYAEKE